MTGFASAQGQTPLGLLSIELRSVNSRFLDLTLRLSDEVRSLEPLFRETIGAAVKRGKLECRADIKDAQDFEASLNVSALERLLALQDEIRSRSPEASPLSVQSILETPGILSSAEVDADELARAVAAVPPTPC